MRISFFIATLLVTTAGHAQFVLSGTVYDSARIYSIDGVKVYSTGGTFSITDSLGHYSIAVQENDSIYFLYKTKPTPKYPVKTIGDLQHFDIALHVNHKGKYKALKEVVVFSKNYRQDSLENRQLYADVFEYKKPGLRTSINPGGAVGADVNELINIFRFRRNKSLRQFQLRLEAQEQEKYIDYRFSKIFVRRTTGLTGTQLDDFMVRYRPTYEFLQLCDELALTQYVLNCSYEYKARLLKK